MQVDKSATPRSPDDLLGSPFRRDHATCFFSLDETTQAPMRVAWLRLKQLSLQNAERDLRAGRRRPRPPSHTSARDPSAATVPDTRCVASPAARRAVGWSPPARAPP